jgi:uncharacterized repeat protein (TIGR03803 family)
MLLSSALVVFAGAGEARSAPFQVLHTFANGNDGASPGGDLIADKVGNLYGTTSEGGPNGAGSVFKLAPDGTVTTIYNFTGGNDGDLPLAGLLSDAQGNLYGVTEIGGANDWGVVFKVTPGGQETVIHAFTGDGHDGVNPLGQLIWGPDHILIGTTLNGGFYGYGTVFQLTLSGTETVTHAFNGRKGRYPAAGLVMDKAGNMYGTTHNSGAGSSGLVYEIDAVGVFHVLLTCTNATGYFPSGALTLDDSGVLYGSMSAGGANNYGTVFKLTPGAGHQVLYSFTNGNDGAGPLGRLFLDTYGSLLGTTQSGGEHDDGTIFSLSPYSKLTTLHAFDGTTGSFPQAGLVRDTPLGGGWLYGLAYAGGSGNGTAFRVKK